ncbi:hypothetical protein ACFPRL_16620 [Pseudoclavibacter helvolus]
MSIPFVGVPIPDDTRRYIGECRCSWVLPSSWVLARRVLLAVAKYWYSVLLSTGSHRY